MPRVFEIIKGGEKTSYELTTKHYVEFDEMVEFIKQSREKAYRAINYELICTGKLESLLVSKRWIIVGGKVSLKSSL